MDLVESTRPAATLKYGVQEVTLSAPAKLKIQTTGPGAESVLELGPENGKTWTATVRVEITES